MVNSGSIRQAVILCGGLGTRLHPYTLTLPKPMIPTNGRPFLRYIVDQLAAQGITKVLLVTGYRGEQIQEYFGDGTAPAGMAGVDISYAHGPAAWETARRIWEARAALDARFLLLYSDNFIPFSLPRLAAFHGVQARPITVSLCRKAAGNIRLDASGVVEAYDSSRVEPGLDYVEVGYMIVERDPMLTAIRDPDGSFSGVLRHFAQTGALAGMVLQDRYQSISDPDRWRKAENYLASKRILLLDRDGTLNVRPPQGAYVSSWAEFQWLPDARQGLEVLTQAGFEFAVVTNQAGIARGMISRAAVDDIHDNLRADFLRQGAKLHDIYMCPHHWDEGCTCRKPKPGMLIDASRDLNLRLDRTVYVGDDPRDCETAAAACCVGAYVGDPGELDILPSQSRPEIVGVSLLAVAPALVARFEAWEARDRQ